MKCSLWYSTWMGKSEQGLCTSQCLAPGKEGRAFPGYLTQSLLPWVENRRGFDKTQDPKGGDV